MVFTVIPSEAKESENIKNNKRLLRHFIPRKDQRRKNVQKFPNISFLKLEIPDNCVSLSLLLHF